MTSLAQRIYGLVYLSKVKLSGHHLKTHIIQNALMPLFSLIIHVDNKNRKEVITQILPSP